MALQSSGPISFANIQTEFGGSNPIGMDEYYKGGGLVPTTSTETITPSSLTITQNWNQRSPYPQYWYGPTITTSNNYTGYALYAHLLWSDNGTTGYQDCTFYVDKTGNYNYYLSGKNSSRDA